MDRLPHQSDALLGRFCENPGSFCENPGRVLGGLWESSQDTLGEFWRHFGRARGQLLLQGIGRGQLGMHGISPNFISPNVISPNVISPNIISPNITSPNVISPNNISPNNISPNIISLNIISLNIISPNVISPTLIANACRIHNTKIFFACGALLFPKKSNNMY